LLKRGAVQKELGSPLRVSKKIYELNKVLQAQVWPKKSTRAARKRLKKL
jgi:hypothetical protein